MHVFSLWIKTSSVDLSPVVVAEDKYTVGKPGGEAVNYF
jgi:hypothetical protein